MLKNLNDILKIAKTKGPKVVAVAAAEDEPVISALKDAVKEGLVKPILVGDEVKIREISAALSFELSSCEIVHVPVPEKAALEAVKLVSSKKADVLMKGLVSTAGLMKAVLDKEVGLRTTNKITHLCMFEVPAYHKILSLSDAAMNIAPDLDTKVSIINNAVSVYHKLGIKNPKVAIMSAVEVVNPAIPATIDAAILKTMNQRKQIKGCLIDGPFAMDNALSSEACHHKGIETEVGGDVDILVMPDLNSANMVNKTINYLAGATMAGIILGARAPIVLTSRADSDRTKLMSIAAAVALS